LRRKEAQIFQGLAPYLSHNPATIWRTLMHGIAGLPVGAAGVHEIGDRRSMMNPSPVPDGQATSRDLNSIFVRDSGLIVGL
jgi:hypothetical protein